MQAKRLLWADIAKFFAIVFVVCGHLGLPYYLRIAIHMFHVPIFFILGGVFYSKVKYQHFSTFFFARVRSLLVPYIAWGVISYGVYRLIPNATGMTEIVSLRRFILSLFTQDANRPLFYNFGVIQWFFTALFFSEMTMWVIIRVSDRIPQSYRPLYYGIVAVLLIILNTVVCRYIEPNWLGFKSSIFGALFCLIGFALKNVIKRILDASNRTKLFIALVSSVAFISVFFLNGSVNMRTVSYNNPLLFILGAISGSLLVYIISREVEICLPDGLMKSYFLYIGRNTALVLCTNRLVQYTIVLLINILISNFLNIKSGMGLLIKQVIDLVVEMLTFVPIIYLVNRFFPFTLGKSFKKSK